MRPTLRQLPPLRIAVPLPSALGRWVGEQSYRTDCEAPDAATAVASATILMKVCDEHQYVTNADDPPRHAGQGRAESGSPRHVSTEESVLLSDIMQRDLSKKIPTIDDSAKLARPLDREIPVAMQDRDSPGGRHAETLFAFDLQYRAREQCGEAAVHETLNGASREGGGVLP